MLLVVLGAGASYDAVPVYPPPSLEGTPMRLPLANDLFAERYLSYIAHFPRCFPIIPYLMNQQSGVTVERVLQQLQDEGESNPERHNQLTAVRYYLHYMIGSHDLNWCRSAVGVTNHLTMLDQIRHVLGNQPICIVTFNYDRIIETVLAQRGITFASIDDYIRNDLCTLFKLHGSVNWGREVISPIAGLPDTNWLALAQQIIDQAHELKVSDRFHVVQDQPIFHFDGKPLYPAMAIPLETKTAYECPLEHVGVLRSQLAEVDQVIIVGWRAADQPFVRMLADLLGGTLNGLVIAASETDAQETIERLTSAKVPCKFRATPGGFTDTIVRRTIEQFLREK